MPQLNRRNSFQPRRCRNWQPRFQLLRSLRQLFTSTCTQRKFGRDLIGRRLITVPIGNSSSTSRPRPLWERSTTQPSTGSAVAAASEISTGTMLPLRRGSARRSRGAGAASLEEWRGPSSAASPAAAQRLAVLAQLALHQRQRLLQRFDLAQQLFRSLEKLLGIIHPRPPARLRPGIQDSPAVRRCQTTARAHRDRNGCAPRERRSQRNTAPESFLVLASALSAGIMPLARYVNP